MLTVVDHRPLAAIMLVLVAALAVALFYVRDFRAATPACSPVPQGWNVTTGEPAPVELRWEDQADGSRTLSIRLDDGAPVRVLTIWPFPTKKGGA